MSQISAEGLHNLRRQIAALEGGGAMAGVVPFGIDVLDAHLSGGGLVRGALHDVAGASSGAIDGAVAAAFLANIAARATGQVLWCSAHGDLYAPGLQQAGLGPERVIHVEARDDKAVLATCEEALRHGVLSAVVGEVARLPLIASRRLQLAAGNTTSLALILRRWKRERDAADFDLPTAAVTRWRVAAAPAAPLPVAGIGRVRWHLELLRSKGGRTGEFLVEICDDRVRLALAAPLVHRPAAAERQLRSAS